MGDQPERVDEPKGRLLAIAARHAAQRVGGRARELGPPNREDRPAELGVAEALRAAVERTMRATAGSAASTRGHAADLVDEVVRRGLDARAELSRR
ncbi:MAG: hypothetical protein GEU88_18490, partial [Solirubrobacterales bacterium]|nr:hypothetical protein [Solirubrobacterales bacterium]